MGFFKWLYHLNDAPKEIRHLHWKLRNELMQECQRRVNPQSKQKDAIEALVEPVGCVAIALGIYGVINWGWCLGITLGFLPFLALAIWNAIIDNRLGAEPDKSSALKKILYERNIRPGYCLDCGYDLRGITGEHCPECGVELPIGLAPESDN